MENWPPADFTKLANPNVADLTYQWKLTLAVLGVGVSTIHWRSRYGMLLHARIGKTRAGHDTWGIVLHHNQYDEIHLCRLGTPGNCEARDWAAFLRRREFAPPFFSYMNRLFLSPAHKDHRFSPWGLPSFRRTKNVLVEIYAPKIATINWRRGSQMRLDLKKDFTYLSYAHGLTQGEHKEILTGSLQHMEINVYFLEMS